MVNLQVSDAKDHVIELRALVSARTSPLAWDLRCEVREKLIAFLRDEYPQALPRQRADLELRRPDAASDAPYGGEARKIVRAAKFSPAESGA